MNKSDGEGCKVDDRENHLHLSEGECVCMVSMCVFAGVCNVLCDEVDDVFYGL